MNVRRQARPSTRGASSDPSILDILTSPATQSVTHFVGTDSEQIGPDVRDDRR